MSILGRSLNPIMNGQTGFVILLAGLIEMIIGVGCILGWQIWVFAIIYCLIGIVGGVLFGLNTLGGIVLVILSGISIWLLLKENTKEWLGKS